MFRLFFTYLLPLIIPALLYLVWNWLQLRRTISGKRQEPPPSFAETPWLILAGAGVSLLMLTLLALALSGDGGAPGSTYVPPHMEDGKLIPGQTR
ncbi:MAG: DUF6111 family protein [Alphaproteobacteria bacterium]|nr:DUF6111 family protein [Alphaproteobacteria bacterium]